ncbi:MAG: magnesium transporter [Candidatus Oxydemutatoraceae bacterium WSBS_2016_MAG_OTU14]
MSLQKNRQNLLEWFFHQIESQNLAGAKEKLEKLPPTEIARLLESLPQEQKDILRGLISVEVKGKVLLELSDDVRNELISKTDQQELVEAVKDMEADDFADLSANLPRKVVNRVLSQLGHDDRKALEQVASYPVDTAGGLMNIDTVTITENITIATALRYLRTLERLPEHTNFLYVVDDENNYLGRVRLAQLLTREPSIVIHDIMDKTLTPIPVNTSDKEVLNYFDDFDLTSAPVVDTDGKLLGRITIDDVLDHARHSARQVEFGAAGLASDESLFGSIRSSLRGRSMWLGINLLTALLASWTINLFDTTLEKTIALAVLLPVVASMGGIAGNQTMTLLIRGIATGQIAASNTIPLLKKELSISVINSLIWGAVVAVVSMAWFGSPLLGGIICIALIFNLVNATLVGFYTPFILNKLKIDPAIAGNVILTTITDIVGIFVFLGLGALLLL